MSDDQSKKRPRKDSALQLAVEEDLRNTREFTSKMLEASLNGVYIHDLELGTNVYLSPRYTRLLGHTLDSLQDLSQDEFAQLFHPDDRQAVREHMARVKQAEDGEVVEIEYRLRTADGRWIWCLSRESVFERDEEGEAVQLMGTLLDITERKRLEAHIAQTDRMASVGLLAAGVAHEINNPLTYVLQNLLTLAEDLPGVVHALTRLQHEVGPARARELLGDDLDLLDPGDLDDLARQASEAVEGARRVRDIVRDLKTFARSEDERLVPLCLNEVLESVVNMAFNEIRYRARLEKNYGDIPDIVANEGKLAQVFLNLLVNAAHAIEEGDVEHNEIRLSTRVEQGHVLTEIADTGKGIPAEDLPHIFEPFFTTKQDALGMGLGLSICHNIITSGGGQILVESEEGCGTRFVVKLPVYGRRQTPEMTQPVVKAPSHRGRFLIIDDEELVARAMKRVLGREHDAVVVTSGAAAQELLQSDQGFDGIICDLMMPEISGMEMFQWLAEHRPVLAQKTLFVTGGAFTPVARKFLRSVKNKVLQKPCKPDDLRAWTREMTAHP